jgi:hypothetical protein
MISMASAERLLYPGGQEAGESDTLRRRQAGKDMKYGAREVPDAEDGKTKEKEA